MKNLVNFLLNINDNMYIRNCTLNKWLWNWCNGLWNSMIMPFMNILIPNLCMFRQKILLLSNFSCSTSLIFSEFWLKSLFNNLLFLLKITLFPGASFSLGPTHILSITYAASNTKINTISHLACFLVSVF